MNIEKFNPKKDPKYIGYIFRFLKKKSKLRKALGAYPRIVKFKDGFDWYIGWFIDDGLGDFIGSRICYGSEKVETFCFVRTPETEVVAEVKWDEYERVGVCALTNWNHKSAFAEFVRTKKEIDKDAILNQKERFSDGQVPGIKIVSGLEDFVIEPTEQELA